MPPTIEKLGVSVGCSFYQVDSHITGTMSMQLHQSTVVPVDNIGEFIVEARKAFKELAEKYSVKTDA